MLLEEAIGKNDLDKIQEIKSDWFKEFGIEMPMTNNTLEQQPIMAAEGGMMSVLPQGMEMDYRPRRNLFLWVLKKKQTTFQQE